MAILESQLVAAIVGGILGLIGGIILLRLQQKKKIVEWDYSSTSLLVNKDKLKRPLKLSIDKSFITHQPKDEGIPALVESAYAFFISIRNVGNEPIEHPIVEVQLDKSAKIVHYTIEPETMPRVYEVQDLNGSEGNVIQLDVPYLNPKGDRVELKLDIVSIENVNEMCDVKIIGMGIEQKRRQRPNRLRNGFLMNAPLIMLGVFLASIVNFWLIISEKPNIVDMVQNNKEIAAILPIAIGGTVLVLLRFRDNSN